MKLFWTPASPFTRKVCVVARELGLWKHIEIIPTTWPLQWGYETVAFTPGLAEANPMARIPTLVTDNGEALGDSTIACLYLNSRAHKLSVIPRGDDVWKMWSRYALADGIVEAQIAMRAELLRPSGHQSMSFVDKQATRIRRCFARLEQQTNEDGDFPDLADITIGVACGYQLWREWLADFRAECPRLAHWYATFSQRPSMQATIPAETPERSGD